MDPLRQGFIDSCLMEGMSRAEAGRDWDAFIGEYEKWNAEPLFDPWTHCPCGEEFEVDTADETNLERVGDVLVPRCPRCGLLQ